MLCEILAQKNLRIPLPADDRAEQGLLIIFKTIPRMSFFYLTLCLFKNASVGLLTDFQPA